MPGGTTAEGHFSRVSSQPTISLVFVISMDGTPMVRCYRAGNGSFLWEAVTLFDGIALPAPGSDLLGETSVTVLD